MCNAKPVCWVGKYPNVGIRYCHDHGWEVTDDKGQTWSFTFRGLTEFQQMHKTLFIDPAYYGQDTEEDRERELFGETLDDGIPDDLFAMLVGTP